jgi:NAD+ synthetase
MPGPYSSPESLTDAQALADKLGIRLLVAPINDSYQSLVAGLTPAFGARPAGVADENLQSRLRGVTLMALSNHTGAIVLTTGNKSEIAVGYTTLYGDMCGGLAVISDVPKTMVYDLSRIANRRHSNAIPEEVFTKPPSAELRPDQKDSDSLPEYAVLDPILEAYIEDLKRPADIAQSLNMPLAVVREVVKKVDRAEYKRKQMAPGLKVTTKAFGMGRRIPIAQRFSE